MRVSNDDAQIDVQIDGNSGDAIVMIAGFPLSRAIWDSQANALRERYRVIRPDLRGMGKSSVSEGPYLMEALAGDIAAVLDQLGIERAAIVGHSLGGFVAMAFARMYVERVAKLALISSRLNADSADLAQKRYELAEQAEAQRSMEPIAEFYRPRLLAPDRGVRDELSGHVGAIIDANDYRGAAAMLRGMAIRVPSDDIAPDVRLPVLIVSGGKDQLMSAELARETAASFPQAELVIAPQSGHVPMLEEPELVTKAIGDWLAR